MKKGDKLYLRFTSPFNLLEGEVEVKSVGRKYFKIFFENKELIFFKNTLKQKTVYLSRYSLYNSKEEYLNLERRKELLQIFREAFAFNWFMVEQKKFTLEQLEEAAKILNLLN
jgi:hypothetical protein